MDQETEEKKEKREKGKEEEITVFLLSLCFSFGELSILFDWFHLCPVPRRELNREMGDLFLLFLAHDALVYTNHQETQGASSPAFCNKTAMPLHSAGKRFKGSGSEEGILAGTCPYL